MYKAIFFNNTSSLVDYVITPNSPTSYVDGWNYGDNTVRVVNVNDNDITILNTYYWNGSSISTRPTMSLSPNRNDIPANGTTSLTISSGIPNPSTLEFFEFPTTGGISNPNVISITDGSLSLTSTFEGDYSFTIRSGIYQDYSFTFKVGPINSSSMFIGEFSQSQTLINNFTLLEIGTFTQTGEAI